MDARVPDDRGLKAIGVAKAQDLSFMIIVLSLNPVLKSQAIAAGADAFVSKSDPPETLRKTLTDILIGRMKLMKCKFNTRPATNQKESTYERPHP